MSIHPILLFPTPNTTNPSRRGGGGESPHKPSVYNQFLRLEPKFERLQNAIENRRIEVVSQNPEINPEYTIVLEIYGSVDDFFKATSKIEGLEWLSEYESRELQSEGGFYSDEDNLEKAINGRVMLLLSDRRAIDELLSLWRRYGQNPEMVFQRGWTKFRDVFSLLKDIRYWSAVDRIHGTGVMNYWEDILEHQPMSPIRFEAELWFRNDDVQREAAQLNVSSIVNNYEGQIIDSCCIPSIHYHSLLIELPACYIDDIIREESVSLIRCDAVMLFRPIGHMCVDPIGDNEAIIENEEEFDLINTNEIIGTPQVALLDGLPLSNHNDLSGKLIIDDPDNFEEGYIASKRIHGTAMASLIINGDLTDNLPPIDSPLYVRPILKYDSQTYRGTETIPLDVLPLDLIHRAVKRMYEGDEDGLPTAPSVKIINMSIGDPNIQFTGKMSPFARLIDWLSQKYNVLFIVSAGNHGKDIIVQQSAQDFRELSAIEQQNSVFKSIHDDTSNRKLLSPAESINAITVGAIHEDGSDIHLRGGKLNLYTDGMPSVYSAHGNGYKRSIKPDIVFTGGRVIHDEPIGNSKLRGTWLNNSPGISVPFPDSTGDLSKRVFSRGTSNAAALTTRGCVEILSNIKNIFQENNLISEFDNYSSLLIKSLIAHGASWNDIYSNLCNRFGSLESQKLKETISQYIGYGKPNIEKVKSCIDTRATILGYGSLEHDQAHVYKLPIPEALGGVNTWRKLTVTLSWFAEPNFQNLKYRDSALWVSLEGENKQLATMRTYQWQQVKRGTLQHEIFEGEAIAVLSQSRDLEIKVNCKKDAVTNLSHPIKYGLAITLEVAPNIEINIYQEIKDAIDVQIQQQAQVPIRVQ